MVEHLVSRRCLVVPGDAMTGGVEDDNSAWLGAVGHDHLPVAGREGVRRMTDAWGHDAPDDPARARDARDPGPTDLGYQDVAVVERRHPVWVVEIAWWLVLTSFGLAPLGHDPLRAGIDDQHAAIAGIRGDDHAVFE